MEARTSRIKRLYYRSWHRGCKETDAVLGYFADHYMRDLDDAALDLYERFLDEADNDIWNWVTSKSSPQSEYISMIEKLKTFSQIHQV